MTTVDLAGIRDDLARAPLVEPWPLAVAIAAVDDVFRLGGDPHPPSASEWRAWAKRRPRLEEQAGVLAHVLASTRLRAGSIAALQARGADRPSPQDTLGAFFDSVEPLTAEMVRTNAFRQEEFLRRWAEAVGATIAGETPARSAQRLDQLDYRRTQKEYQRAEAARKAEAARRAQLLKEAAEKEAAERGWRE